MDPLIPFPKQVESAFAIKDAIEITLLKTVPAAKILFSRQVTCARKAEPVP